MNIMLLNVILGLAGIAVCTATCGYESCNTGTPGLLNVHLIPHTHDDMGWLKTVDQYFWGSKIPIAPGGVNFILNSIIQSLQLDPNRRFTYVETGFFTRWWNMQNDPTRHLVQRLVSNGQLQFANGGWTANDEAAAHYAAIIDQMTLGLGLLNTTMGKCGNPVAGWSIDAFGHSREMASLYAQMGMDGLFFARIHDRDRTARKANKEMEMIWKTSQDLDTSVQNLFTGAFYKGDYGPPNGFCFDEFCDDDPIMDDDRLEGYNVEQKMNAFVYQVYAQAKRYKTNHILLTMGNDFNYMNAGRWFYELEKLIKYVNEGRQAGKHNITTFYSTPTCYLKAVHDLGETWPTKEDDFFPYATGDHSYWTGYFTSRPTFKGYIRQSNALLQVCRQVDAFAGLDNTDIGDLNVLKRAVATAQHHDAVTGTAKQAVTYDYEKRLYQGMKECEQIVNDGLAKAAKQQMNRQFFCPLTNISVCNISQNIDAFTITLFNALSRTQGDFVRIPVPSANYKVEFNGVAIEADAIKVQQSAANVKQTSQYVLVFNATVPAHGFKTYTVTKSNESRGKTQLARKASTQKVWHKKSLKTGVLPFTIENEFVKLSLASTGRLSAVEEIKSGIKADIQHDFMWYKGATESSQPSGAYIFRPNGTLPTHVDPGSIDVEVVKGELVQEVRQTFASWASQVIRLYKGQSTVEMEWTIGPIPVDEKNLTGKEIVSTFMTDIENGDTFFTDANGRQMVKRRRNYQPTYKYNNSEPVAGNYYPVNTRIFIQDSTRQLTILTDRSQGATSIAEGHVELMVHRRLLLDDHFGVNEALNETGADGLGLVARGKHWFQLTAPTKAPRQHRLAAQQIFYKPVATYAQASSQIPASLQQFTGITHDLPPNVNILTLEQGKANAMLLRLEHIFQKNEDPLYSQPVTISLKGLFTTFDVLSIDELALGGDRFLKDVNRFKWKTVNSGQTLNPHSSNGQFNTKDSSLSVTLNPMQIRTFRATVARK